MDERVLVSQLHNQLSVSKDSVAYLKKVLGRINFANRQFREIFEEWWGSETPPNLEADLVLVFEDTERVLDDALIIGVEVKVIRQKANNFYVGVQQALSLALFGFDGIALWQVFDAEFSPALIASFHRAVNDVIYLHRLPLHYSAVQTSTDNKLLYYQDLVSPFEVEVAFLAKLARDCFAQQYSFRRIAFHKIEYLRSHGSRPDEVAEVQTRQALEAAKKRRRTLKTILGIPA